MKCKLVLPLFQTAVLEKTLKSTLDSKEMKPVNPKGNQPWIFIGRTDQFSSVQFSHSAVSDSLWPHRLQHIRISCPSPSPGVCSNSGPLCQWCHQTIKPSHPLSSPSSPAINLSQHQGLFKWVSSSNQVAKVLECQLQHQSFRWTFRTDFL